MASERDIRNLVRRVVDGISSGEEVTQQGSIETETIAIGADHGGYALKERLIGHLRDQGYTVRDCGTNSPDSVRSF